MIINKILIKILGNNNRLIIKQGARITNKDNDYFLLDGNNCSIIIDENTSIQSAHINAQENGSSIYIGKNCMISDGVTIRTSDSHPIYDDNGIRINPPSSVVIEDNVWIAQKCTIMKGVHVGKGSIVGLGSVVTKDIPNNTLSVGVPAKNIKTGISWSRSLK